MDGTLEEALTCHLENAGFKSAVVSVRSLAVLPKDIDDLLEKGLLGRKAYDAIKTQYGLNFMYEPPADFPSAQSVIITAAPQPKVRVRFSISGKEITAIIPPTYSHDTDNVVLGSISEQLGKQGHSAVDAILPGKRIAVHSGLASYGRNNIAYIAGLGSYFRLRAYFTDAVLAGSWQELKMMDICRKCTACIQRCPTKAISKDTFVVDTSRCLTFLNEGEDEFPEWVDPAWHNCLVGCMICQDVCPANREFKSWFIDGEEFSEEETEMILKGVSTAQLPSETCAKLKRLYMLGDERVLQRNLGVLVKRCMDGS